MGSMSDQQDILKNALKRYRDGLDHDRPNRDRDEEDRRFYRGDQWDRADRDKRGDRPTLTINRLPQFVKQITGEIQSDAGRVTFAGHDVTGTTAHDRVRAGLARTFQISTLAGELTVLQQVVLATIGRDRRAFSIWPRTLTLAPRIDEAAAHLARVGLAGLEAVPAGELAHGQRRLLELAIALAVRPKALLLDEPMAGLGDAGSRELTGLLDALRHEVPILLIEHDMDAVFTLADRISVLVYGRILATGTVDEIRANREVREAYLGEAVT